MSRWRREVSGLIYASEGFTPRPPSHPLATKRVMLSYSMHKWPFSHSTIVAIVSIVGPYLGGGDSPIWLFVCLSVRLMDLTGQVHGSPDVGESTTANRARWIAAVRGGKSKKAGGGKHKCGFRGGGIETKQSVPCLSARACVHVLAAVARGE